MKESRAVPINTPFYYGWFIVGISAFGIFFSGPGQTYTNSVFIESYLQEFGWSHTAVSSIYSLATLCSGFLLFTIGKLTDRLGRRFMLTFVSLMLGLACIGSSFVVGMISMFIGFFCIRLFGQGSMTMIPNTLVSQWFIKKRGRALSFAGLGGLIGASFFPPFANWLIETYEWRFAWRVLGIMLLVLFTPLAYFFVRNQPEDVGLRPDHSSGELDQQHAIEDSWTLSEAIKTRAFWFMLVCMAIPAMLFTGLTFQLFSILGDQGVDRTTTALVLSFIPMVSFGSSLISGFIAERVKTHTMLSITFILNAIAPLIWLIFNEPYMVFPFAILWGFAQGFMNIPMALVWPNYYGRQHLGSIQSVTSAAMVIGSALGPIAFGLTYDQWGSYDFVLLLSVIIWVSGAILAFLSPAPSKSPSSLSR